MAHDVFVSYATEDKATADAVVATLEQQGIRCWVAPRDAPPGKHYAEALVQAINGSRVLVLVFSSNANSSPHVMREIERAASRGIPILPLRIEDVTPSESMEYFISGTHWLDALTTPLRQHLEQLARSVTVLLEADAEEGAATVSTHTARAAGERDAQAPPPPKNGLDIGSLWRRHPFVLIGAGALAIAAIAVIAGFVLFLSEGDDDSSAQGDAVAGSDDGETQVVVTHFDASFLGELVSGDCASADLVIQGTGIGELTGDISGGLAVEGEATVYLASECRKGYLSVPFTLTDADGNTLAGTVEGPMDTVAYLTNFLPVQDLSEPATGSTFSSALLINMTNGSGIYARTTGSGECTGIVGGTLNPDSGVEGVLEADCSLELSQETTVQGVAPLIVQLAASPLEIAVAGDSFDSTTAVAFAVLYGNARDETLTNLSVRLPVPGGASILSAALNETDPAEGEHVWQLPDLPPRELARFEFLVQVQGGDPGPLPFEVELDGEGFDAPVGSELVTIDIVP